MYATGIWSRVIQSKNILPTVWHAEMAMEQHYEPKKLAITSDFKMDKKEGKVVDRVVIQVQIILKLMVWF